MKNLKKNNTLICTFLFVCLASYTQAQNKEVPTVFLEDMGYKQYGYKLGDSSILEAKYDEATPFEKVYSVMDKKDIW